MRLNKSKNQSRGPSSSLGLVSFNENTHSLIRFSPELIILFSILFGIFILALQFIY